VMIANAAAIERYLRDAELAHAEKNRAQRQPGARVFANCSLWRCRLSHRPPLSPAPSAMRAARATAASELPPSHIGMGRCTERGRINQAPSTN
jgi:hypothetical protein